MDISSAPYYDDYDPSKGYTQILAIPGRVEQAREFTQLQTLQRDYLGRLGDAVLSNGTIIEGCDLIIRDDHTAVVSPGRIYLQGLVRIVNGQTIEIGGVGSESIGAKVQESLVTEIEDPSLRDPAQNYKNAGQAGAHRIKEEVVFVVNDQEATQLYSLSDGEIVNTSSNSNNDAELSLANTLARRTYDENGSYKVNGLELQDRRESDEDHVYISVKEGKAYVQGYEVTKPTTVRLQLDKAMSTRQVSNEAKSYTPDITYVLNNQPAKDITRSMCLVQYTAQLTRGSITGGIDYITNPDQGSVDSIVSVKSTDGGTTYESGKDYQLTADGVDWSPGGKEPAIGTRYTVVYNYNRVMKDTDFVLTHHHIYLQQVTTAIKRGAKESTEAELRDQIPLQKNQRVRSIEKISKDGTEYTKDTDFTLYTEGEYKSIFSEDAASSNYTAYIQWKTTAGKKPTANTDVYTVLMTLLIEEDDQNNWYVEFTDECKSTMPVINSRMYFNYDFYLSRKDLITLDKNGVYNVYPGQPNVQRLAESVINQDDTQLIIGTVLVIANSNNVIVNTYDSTRLSQANLFALRKRVDNLEYNIAMSDLDQEAIEGEQATQLKGVFTDGFLGLTKCDTTHEDFKCSIDLDTNELTLPTKEIIKAADPGRNPETNISQMGDVYMAPFEHALALQQPYATETFLVNEYAVFNNMSLIELSPHTDNWIDTEHITVDGGTSTAPSTTLRRWWYHRGESWAESEKQKWLELTGTTGEQLGWSNYSGETTTTTTDVVLDEAIMYMRSITVTISGSNFLPNSDSLICLFNETKVPLTPTGQTQQGTTEGSVKADINGRFTATFKVPTNVPCGSVEVVVKNDHNRGTAVYKAQGRRQVIQDTVFKTKVVVNTTDPLAQSFVFTEDTILTKVGVYFQAKDEVKNIVFQIRNMVNGYPGTIVYDEEVIEVADIKTSEDSSVVTEVTLSQPVYCSANTMYCFSILSDSDNYSMFTATLGEMDILKKVAVTSQPYTAGVMFSSSNQMTWTAHQTTDLKFDLYKAEFKEKGVIVFSDITTEEINRFVVAANSVDYKNAGIDWYYRLSADSNWLPIDTYVSLDLDRLSSMVQLRCELNTKYSSSPILAGDCVNLIGFIEELQGVYISRTVFMNEPFNTINLSYEAALPSGTEVKPKYSLDNISWNDFDSDGDPEPLSLEFNRYKFKKESLPASTTMYKLRIELKSSNALARPRVRRLMSILKNL